MTRKLTDDQREEAIKRYEAGENCRQLAPDYGVNPASLSDLLKRNGCKMRPVGTIPKFKPPRMCHGCEMVELPKQHRWCEECAKDRLKLWYKNNRKKAIADGRCVTCNKSRDRDGVCCSGCSKKHRARDAKIKAECFAGYGGKCQCCGETEIAFLTIDHVNDDGAERRRKKEVSGNGCGIPLYRHLIKANFPHDHQLLCMNCQLGKKLCGVCPHKAKKPLRLRS